jgi:hypothetical protein
MKLPKGIETRYGNGRTHVLKLLKNLYGQKQAGRVWNEHLVSGLREIGFEQSKVDECVFYRGKTIFVVYVDDGIFASPNEEEIDKAINDLREANFDIEDKGDITDYLGVRVSYEKDGKIKLWQPHLIDSIVKDAKEVTKLSKTARQTPTLATESIPPLLRMDLGTYVGEGKDSDHPSTQCTYGSRRGRMQPYPPQ